MAASSGILKTLFRCSDGTSRRLRKVEYYFCVTVGTHCVDFALISFAALAMGVPRELLCLQYCFSSTGIENRVSQYFALSGAHLNVWATHAFQTPKTSHLFKVKAICG